ncbi:MAG: class I SAM-dependent methyltransferase [Catalinimonas sp.]
MTQKSTVEQIRQRFDADVERFSNLQTGQSATVDAPLALELVVQTAAALHPDATHVLDVGCGAGNYTLKLLERLPRLHATLLDLSQPMLDRAVARVAPATTGEVTARRGDVRTVDLGEGCYDVVLAAAVLHHLRDDADWHRVFTKLFRATKPGGSLWIVDLVEHVHPAVQALMWEGYGAYLTDFRDQAYRDAVFAYIEREDSPRPLMYQIDLLRTVGFAEVDVLHKHGCFAAFGGIKPS